MAGKSFRQASHEKLERDVRRRERRKIRARGRKDESIWFGIGTFGLVGWSVTIPTVIGVLVGVWIDRKWPSQYSWTLMLLFIGIVIGCYNAWYWVTKHRKDIEREHEEDRDE